MSEEIKNPENSQSGSTEDEYPSANAESIAAARAANNTWSFEGREMEMYVARGEAAVETSVLDRVTKEPSGTLLIHNFGWDKENAFVSRASSMVTKLRRVGRSNDQEVDTAHLITVNAELYKAIVSGGALKTPDGNGKFKARALTRDEMLKHATLYPESASEAIESWLASATFEVVNEGETSFDYLFEASDTVKVKWCLGDKDFPVAAGFLIFKSPGSEARREYDQAVSKLKTRRQGEINIAEMQENFSKKIQYGLKHLTNVEGIAVEIEGQAFSPENKQKFVVLWNPIWLAEAVDVLNESFEIIEGKSKTS